MVQNSTSQYPFPLEIPRKFASELFQTLSTGENVTSIWVGSAGRRLISHFLVNHQEEIQEAVPNLTDYLLVYIEPLELTENSQSGYLKLIGRTFIQSCKERSDLKCDFDEELVSLFDSENAPYTKLLDGLKVAFQKIIDQNLEIVLLLGEFDELEFINSVFSNNLKAVWNKFSGRLHYVFLIKDLRLIFDQNQYGEELRYLVFQNLLYWPLNKDSEEYFINYFENKANFKLTTEQRDLIKNICDGHPYFLKLAIETLAKKSAEKELGLEEANSLIRSNYEIRAVSDRILEVMTANIRDFLKTITASEVKELPNQEDIQALESLGLITKDASGNYQPFCLAFNDAILKTSLPTAPTATGNKKGLVLDPDINSITFDGKLIDEELTRQEYELLSYFLKFPNKLHSRDQIAEALWGKDSFEKYSDWAIDQLISKLRKKLSSLQISESTLVTIRGRGYKLVITT